VHLANSYIQAEIRQISRDKASSVDVWIAHAKTIQNDIDKSRKLANAVVREAEADEERLEGLKDKENTVEFLTKEVAFSASLRDGLKAIQVTRDRLRDVEKLATERKIHEALITLEGMIIASPRLEHRHPPFFQFQQNTQFSLCSI
jgi:centromere/kinetochore protein ZW10